jgi:hypothetical protein
MQYVALALALALTGACYSPQYRDCQFSCTKDQCPSGLECTDGVCRLPGMTGACDEPPMPDAAADADTRGPIPLDMLSNRQLTALCERNVRCGVSDDLQSCMMIFGNLLKPRSTDLTAAVTAGKLVYHPDRAAACVATVAGLACDRDTANRRSFGLDCATIFEGTLPGGQTCTMDEECISQACSIDPTCIDACCLGTCSGSTAPSLRDLNATCIPNVDICTTGYCSTSTLHCESPIADNGVCASNDQCNPSSTCRQGAGHTLCLPLVHNLGNCSFSLDCKSLGDVCNGKCVTGGLTGAPCGSASECQDLHGCAGSCTPPPTLNQSCSPFSICQSGYCNASSGTCTAKKDDGVQCDTNMSGRDCTSGFCNTMMPIPKCETRPVCI